MIMKSNNSAKKPVWMTVLAVGAMWGIFESTVGYILHLLPINIGFLVWFPAACYFMLKAYRESGKSYAIPLTASFTSAIKLLNLMFPCRIDRVINPAVSILLEGIALWVAILVYEKTEYKEQTEGWFMAVLAVGVNILWRLLYLGYIALTVPEWMYEISALKDPTALLNFLVIESLMTGVLLWLGHRIFVRIKSDFGRKVSMPVNLPGGLISLLIAGDIGLQLLLR